MISCYSILFVLGLAGVTTQPAAVESTQAGARVASPVGTEDMRIAVPGQGRVMSYLLGRPAVYRPDDRPALLVVLHGTDDVAADAMRFWSERQHDLPLMVVAPQAVGKGWRDEDVPALMIMLDDLRRRAPFDETRILLAGFSAGGVMTMHLLYAEKWPLCAAAALANYVPPLLTAEQIGAKRDVPVFYAVGMTDINHEKMRGGLELLRSARANVDLYRPAIGHVLDPRVGQAAMDWLVLRARRAVTARIDEAKFKPSPESAAILEDIVTQSQWHDQANVDAAERALRKMEGAGRERVEQAKTTIQEGRSIDALELLAGVDAGGVSARLGREVATLREKLLDNPEVKEKWDRNRTKTRSEEALRMYSSAQRLVAEGKYKEAMTRCSQVQQDFAGTPAAQRAKYLAELIRENHLVE